MSRFILGIAFVLIASLSGPAFGGTAPIEDALSEKVMGDPNAPVTVIEYASLSCSHCKAFHRDTLPKIKEEYIDTGKVKLIYRDFPLGSLALAGSMLARCAGTTKFFGMVDALFKAQKSWTRSDTPLDEMERIARFAGMSPDDVDACLDTEPLMRGIQKTAEDGKRKYKIDSTPTFVVGETIIRGNLAFDDFKGVLDKALAGK